MTQIIVADATWKYRRRRDVEISSPTRRGNIVTSFARSGLFQDARRTGSLPPAST
jgi:hypothetical protein